MDDSTETTTRRGLPPEYMGVAFCSRVMDKFEEGIPSFEIIASGLVVVY